MHNCLCLAYHWKFWDGRFYVFESFFFFFILQHNSQTIRITIAPIYTYILYYLCILFNNLSSNICWFVLKLEAEGAKAKVNEAECIISDVEFAYLIIFHLHSNFHNLCHFFRCIYYLSTVTIEKWWMRVSFYNVAENKNHFGIVCLHLLLLLDVYCFCWTPRSSICFQLTQNTFFTHIFA